jgi:hypothetical protein
MNQRFAALLSLLAVAILLLLVGAFVSRVWEGFRGQCGHSGVRYGIAYHGGSRMSLNAPPYV